MLGYVQRAIDDGAAIFKIHLQVGGFPPGEPQLDPVWGLLADAGIPVVIHAGHAPVAAACTGPESFAPLLARHPRLTAIIAHMGAPDYEDFVRLAEDHERVALDTTMAFTSFFDELAPFPRGLLPRVRDLGQAGKVLLGTDFPGPPLRRELPGPPSARGVSVPPGAAGQGSRPLKRARRPVRRAEPRRGA